MTFDLSHFLELYALAGIGHDALKLAEKNRDAANSQRKPLLALVEDLPLPLEDGIYDVAKDTYATLMRDVENYLRLSPPTLQLESRRIPADNFQFYELLLSLPGKDAPRNPSAIGALVWTLNNITLQPSSIPAYWMKVNEDTTKEGKAWLAIECPSKIPFSGISVIEPEYEKLCDYLGELKKSLSDMAIDITYEPKMLQGHSHLDNFLYLVMNTQEKKCWTCSPTL